MKTLKYIIILIMSIGMFNSCLIDDESTLDLNDKGPNFGGFEQIRTTIAGIADGTEYEQEMRVKVFGPSVTNLTKDITLTVEVDPASTAVEGTHFRIDNPSVVLTNSNNYLGLLKLTMLTEGIVTPLAKAPILILNAKSATGEDKLINSGKSIEITMNFACFSEFQGEYSVVTTSSTGAKVEWNETISKIGTEEYLTQRVGTWDPPLNPDYGFTFSNACNVISVPNQDLADMYSNEVFGHELGSVDPDTGVMTIQYTITFDAGDRTYTAVYTPL